MTLADRIAVMKGGILQQFGTPQEVYDEPANIFVAGFMGSPSMNFLTVEIGEENGKPHALIESEGQTYALPCPEGQADLSGHIGKEVILGIRPEQLTHVMPHVESSPFVTKVSIKVEVTEPTGADTLVLTRVNGEECECRVHPAEAGKPGENMDILFNMEKAVFFDPQNEDRL
jgi:multiple sugar transport system ATP-binding protein